MKFLAVFVAAVLTPCAFCTTTYYVDANRPDDSGNGLSWATAKRTIQAAVDLAVNGDTVLVTNGVYAYGGRVRPGCMLSNRVMITQPITLRSVNGADVTIVAGAADPATGGIGTNAVRCVYATNRAVIAGLTLSNGHTATASGPWCVGGGAYLEGGSVLSNCHVRGCGAMAGGGLYVNKAHVEQCVIANNHAADDAGGLYIEESTVGNCLVHGNVAAAWAGGIMVGPYFVGGNSYLRNCTVVSNAADDIGGVGWYLHGKHVIYNSIIYYNVGATLSNTPATQEFRLDRCCVMPDLFAYGMIITNAPAFVNAAAGLFHLTEQSPCVNAGSNLYVASAYDLDGAQRIQKGVVDLGAYESPYGAVPGPPVIVQVQPPDWALLATSAVTMLMTVTDDAGVSNVTVDGATAAPAGGDNWSYTTIIARGTNTREIIAGDFDALCATALVHYVYTNQVDAPTIDSITPPDLYIAGLCPVTMTIVAYSSIGVSNVTVNADPATQLSTDTWTYTVSLGPGTNAYIVRAFDAAMNMVQETVRYISSLPTVGPNTLCVAPFGSATPPYTNWTTAARVLQDAVDVAVTGARVLVAPGVYDTGESSPGNALSNRVTIVKAITVESLCGPAVTHIVGQGPRGPEGVRCAYLDNGAVLAGFTLSNGHTRASGDTFVCAGGGAFLQYDTVLSNCVVTMCSALDGGGVYGGADSLVVDSVIITNSVAYGRGAGLFCVAGSVVSNCLISRNRNIGTAPGRGGGVFCDHGGLVTDCELSFNTGGGGGGGAWLDYGGVVNRSIIRGNNNSFGSGAAVDNAGLIANSLIYENEGQGLYYNYGGSNINCTIARNAGDGIIARGNVAVYNTIAYLNTGVNFTRDSSADVLYCCTTPATSGEGNISDDPRFMNAAGGDFRLRDSSPCIDAGTNLPWMANATDLDGNPRIYDGRVDMGCYEYVPEPGIGVLIIFTMYNVQCAMWRRHKRKRSTAGTRSV